MKIKPDTSGLALGGLAFLGTMAKSLLTSRPTMGFHPTLSGRSMKTKPDTSGLEPEAAMGPPDMTVKNLLTSRPMLDSHKMM